MQMNVGKVVVVASVAAANECRQESSYEWL